MIYGTRMTRIKRVIADDYFDSNKKACKLLNVTYTLFCFLKRIRRFPIVRILQNPIIHVLPFLIELINQK